MSSSPADCRSHPGRLTPPPRCSPARPARWRSELGMWTLSMCTRRLKRVASPPSADTTTGMHLFEDLVIPEVVDNDYRPVPLGHSGDRLLVTVLFSRTIPLIRYELTDRLRLST